MSRMCIKVHKSFNFYIHHSKQRQVEKKIMTKTCINFKKKSTEMLLFNSSYCAITSFNGNSSSSLIYSVEKLLYYCRWRFNQFFCKLTPEFSYRILSRKHCKI